jgi:hypothetical protein
MRVYKHLVGSLDLIQIVSAYFPIFLINLLIYFVEFFTGGAGRRDGYLSRVDSIPRCRRRCRKRQRAGRRAERERVERAKAKTREREAREVERKREQMDGWMEHNRIDLIRVLQAIFIQVF